MNTTNLLRKISFITLFAASLCLTSETFAHNGRRDRRENVRDHRENKRDRRENDRDRRENNTRRKIQWQKTLISVKIIRDHREEPLKGLSPGR